MSTVEVYFRVSDGEILGWVTGGSADPRPDCSIASVEGPDRGEIIPDPKRQKIDLDTLRIVEKSPAEISMALMPALIEMTQLVYGELLSTDCFMLPDFPISEEARRHWRAYRQSLRELSRCASPYEMLLAWPTRPDGVDPSASLHLRMQAR